MEPRRVTGSVVSGAGPLSQLEAMGHAWVDQLASYEKLPLADTAKRVRGAETGIAKRVRAEFEKLQDLREREEEGRARSSREERGDLGTCEST
eukprot:324170-Hanusia_phi.AAC.2